MKGSHGKLIVVRTAILDWNETASGLKPEKIEFGIASWNEPEPDKLACFTKDRDLILQNYQNNLNFPGLRSSNQLHG